MTSTNQSRGEAINTKIQAAIKMTAAVGKAIADLGSVPSGVLYANVMNHMDLETYQGVIELLKKGGLVKESNNVLTWIGPSLR